MLVGRLLPALLAGLSVACSAPHSHAPRSSLREDWHAVLGAELQTLDRDLAELAAALGVAGSALSPTERLELLAARDARIERAWDEILSPASPAPVPYHATSYVERPLLRRLAAIRADNARALTKLLTEVGWFTRSEFGALADRRAWSIVQHADHDLEFQREMLVVLEGLAEIGETDPVHVAYLTDRIAVAEDRPQTYGTQGDCASGLWRPAPIEAPEAVDERRAAVGLGPLAEQIEVASERCR